MGIERRQLEGDRKRIAKILVADENGEVQQTSLAVWHRPFTPAVSQRVTEIEEEIQQTFKEAPGQQQRFQVLVEQLAYILTRWDVTDDGQPVPPTAKNLALFEFEFLTAIQDAIFEPLYPKSTT